MTADRRIDIFENMPVKKAVIKQIVPAIAAQMIAVLYSLADTYFVGMLNQPAQTAAVTVVAPSFVMLTAASNLFGVGGASLISRKLGVHKDAEATEASAVSFWWGLMTALLLSVLFLTFAKPVLTVCGADDSTYSLAYAYAKWTVIIGAPFTVMSTLTSNLVRAEGSALSASIGVSLGGIINIILDPLFVLPRFLGLGAEGAGIATLISNLISALYFLIHLLLHSKQSIISLKPRHLMRTRAYMGQILAIGFPSAIQYALTVVAAAAQTKFVSAYSTEAVAAFGIVKKIDQLPLFFSIGVASGILPLLAYNHAAENFERRSAAFKLGCLISVGFALLCVALYEGFAPEIAGLFIDDAITVEYASQFLRRMVLAMPMMAICYPMILQFQAMGKARQSLIASVLRKGVLDIPLLFLMDSLIPLYGCMWVQPIVDTVSLAVATAMYIKIKKSET